MDITKTKNTENHISRRKALGTMLKATAGLTLLGPLSSCNIFSSSPTPTLTSGYLPILDSVPLIVAYAKGFFEENGIKAEKPSLIRAWPPLYEAFTSKQILLTHILLPQVIFMKYQQKVNLKSIAYNHTDVVAMMISKDLDSVNELGGKLVGCPTWWAPHTGVFQDVLRATGLKPVVGKSKEQLAKDEVGFRVVPPPDMPEYLKTGAIAGCTVSEPFGALAEIKAEAKLVKMSGDVWLHHPCCQSVLLEETINNDKEWAEAVTNAIYRASLWSHENKEELAEILGKDGDGYFPMPSKIIKRALLKKDLASYGPQGTGAIMHTDWDVERVAFNPYPFPSAFQVTIDMMKRMVVDPSVQMPSNIRSLTGQQIADNIVAYDLAKAGYDKIGGKSAFGMRDKLGKYEREEVYDVVLKSDSIKS